jgi:predicted dehydrogenase
MQEPQNGRQRLANPMRLGLIGLGYWGHNYLRLLQSHSEAHLAVVCDSSAEMLDVARDAASGSRRTTDPEEVFAADDVDAIIVATPASTHFGLVRGALEGGKHVLCEKPLALDVDTCRLLVELAEDVGRTLFVGHTFVYNSAIREARRLVRANELGSPLHFHAVWAAPGPIRTDVNALWDLAPHPVSILIDLLGRPPSTVSATGAAILDHAREDLVSMHLDFGVSASADIHLSWLAPHKVRTMTITGNRSMIMFDDLAEQEKLRIFDTKRVNGLAEAVRAGQAPTRKKSIPELAVRVPKIPLSEPLAAQLQHFIDCCERGSSCESDGGAGSDVVHVLEVAQRSLVEGTRLAVAEREAFA